MRRKILGDLGKIISEDPDVQLDTSNATEVEDKLSEILDIVTRYRGMSSRLLGRKSHLSEDRLGRYVEYLERLVLVKRRYPTKEDQQKGFYLITPTKQGYKAVQARL